ncbi:hypothetical protein B7486_55760 [cyanobacterium TDX16]|nr:hypothetical protein B7486_55760 [cyanobacterium TDX16]
MGHDLRTRSTPRGRAASPPERAAPRTPRAPMPRRLTRRAGPHAGLQSAVGRQLRWTIVSDPTPEQRLTVDETTSDGQVVLTLTGELDPHTAATLQAVLDRTLADGPATLLFDLTDLKFIDSSGLRVLIDAHKALSERGGELVVRNPSTTARRLFEITKLDDHFRIEQTDPTA